MNIKVAGSNPALVNCFVVPQKLIYMYPVSFLCGIVPWSLLSYGMVLENNWTKLLVFANLLKNAVIGTASIHGLPRIVGLREWNIENYSRGMYYLGLYLREKLLEALVRHNSFRYITSNGTGLKKIIRFSQKFRVTNIVFIIV